MIFISVFFVGLGNDTAGLFLQPARRKHQLMLVAGPVLIGGEAEPAGGAVLMDGIDGMAGSEMLVRIPFFEPGAGLVGPLLVTVTVEVVAQVPGDVRERPQTRHRVANEPVF